MLPTLSTIKSIVDDRGALSFAEIGGGFPFEPKRFFLVHDVPAGTTRGGHAHRHCEQFLIAVSGSVAVVLDNGESQAEFLLQRPDEALHVPAGIWGEQRYLGNDSCLLVLASDPYDPSDYLMDYAEFLTFRKALP